MELSLAEYTTEVSQLAAAIAKEAIDDNLDVSDVMHETIDSHHWMIYNGYHLLILQHSRNDGAYFDEFGPLTATGLDDCMSKLAFAAFSADVRDALPETEPCSECGELKLSDAACRCETSEASEASEEDASQAEA